MNVCSESLRLTIALFEDHALESKIRSNPQKQFCYSGVIRSLYCSSHEVTSEVDHGQLIFFQVKFDII